MAAGPESTRGTCSEGPSQEQPAPSPRQAKVLGELALVFLRLGLTSFGGPAAYLALMEEEFVGRRGWLTHQQFLDLLGAVNLIPGPNATEMAIHIGFLRARWAGLIVAGTCFILPATVLATLLAWVYVTYGLLPTAVGLLYGIKPVIIAVILEALLRLTPMASRTWFLALVAFGAAVATVLGVNELHVLFGGGLLVCFVRGVLRLSRGRKGMASLLLAAVPVVGQAPAFSMLLLFLFFLKVGAILFGSGYVLLAFLRADLVDYYGWLTDGELMDAVAAGQVTPGPLFCTATFIGYIVAHKHGQSGLLGAGVATVGIFLPAFVYVALSGLVLPWIRRSAWAGAFLDGLNAASLALMAVVSWHLGRATLVPDGKIDLPAILLAVCSWILLRRRVNSLVLIIAGGTFGLLWHLLAG